MSVGENSSEGWVGREEDHENRPRDLFPLSNLGDKKGAADKK